MRIYFLPRLSFIHIITTVFSSPHPQRIAKLCSSSVCRLHVGTRTAVRLVKVHGTNFVASHQRSRLDRCSSAFVHAERIVIDRHSRDFFDYRPMSAVALPDDHTVKHDYVVKILQTSVQHVRLTPKEPRSEPGIGDDGIYQAIQILHLLAHRANSYDPEDSKMDLHNSLGKSAIPIHGKSSHIDELACTALTANHSLHHLVHRFRSYHRKIGKRRTRNGSGGKEWKALQIVVGSVLNQCAVPSSDLGSRYVDRRQSLAVAMLAMGITLAFQSSSLDNSSNDSEDSNDRTSSTQPITKMVASALLSDLSPHVYESPLDDTSKTTGDLVVYEFSRSIVLELLHHFVQQYTHGDLMNKSSVMDIQVINKLARGFGVGGQVGKLTEDSELHHAVSSVVVTIFGKRMLDDHSESIGSGDVVRKDADAAVLSLVASTRPWKVVKADRLITIAAEYDLWFAAENICDAALASVGEVNSDQTQYSIAHSTTRAIIDAALGYRQYRRADQFASKYYSFGGPERYAEARYLHACDTISKLIRKKVAQLIDKQVEGVDAAVARVRNDSVLPTFISTQCNERHSNSTSIETMSENVREFSLRRLRAANMDSEALRLARLWGMTYEHDPVQMMHEAKLRKLNYLQWDDEGCPGSITINTDGIRSGPPELISDPTDLICRFRLLHESNDERTIGFDAEWGDDGPGVSLLQLSSTSHALLLDIPALTSTSHGCDALRITVGQLFSGILNIQDVVGFGCKEDFSRLRASPSLPGRNGSKHWFPSHNILKARDLRQFIAETSPKLGSRGSPIGLSAACEHFLGKALDKSEQCSDWSARPLTKEQLEYAALDAWACAAIHVKIASSQKVLPAP
ncbi:hypothetical protein ACHAW6_005232 [Cyclotella cf. meneghiniana]